MTNSSTGMRDGDNTILMGAVAAAPEVVTIWNGFKEWLQKRGFPFDYILYSNYERQVADLVCGRIDAAWNTPLAWVRAERLAEAAGKKVEAVVMREVDFDLTSVIVVSSGSDIKSVDGLKGHTLGVGSPDSVESTLMPLSRVREAGLDPANDVSVRHYSDVVGLHGGHQEGEQAAARALVVGEVDAAGLATGNYEKFVSGGIIPSGSTRVLAYTAPYDHCNLTCCETVSSEHVDRLRELFLAMSYDDPELRTCMELESVKEWQPARTDFYETMRRAAME